MWRKYLAAGLCIAVLGWAQAASAGTIIKLSLGGDNAADIEYDGTTLSTNSDGNAATTGDQNTAIEYSDFLSGNPDVPLSIASFTLDGLTTAGAPTVFGGALVIQNFAGGTMSLYDPLNTLLLSGTLASSALTGPIGPPSTGALFTTSFGTVTGGTLAPLILPNTLTLSMSLNDVNGGAGFSVSGAAAPALDPFTADATVSIGGEIPEPTSAMLIGLGTLAVAAMATRRR